MLMSVCTTIKGFKSADGTDLIRAWYRDADSKIKAAFDVKTEYLAQRKPQDWQFPYYRALHFECTGLGEIRFTVNKVRHRPIGFFSGKDEFTILFFATEKGDKFVPKSACKTAQERKEMVRTNPGRRHQHEWGIKN
jgi:hypothetical protein